MKRLLLIVALGVASNSLVSADVIYGTKLPPVADKPCGHHSYVVDANGDRVGDFCYTVPCCDCISGCSSVFRSWNASEVSSDGLAYGAIVGPEMVWTDQTVWLFDATGCYSGIGCGQIIFPEFVGLKFLIGDETHYGWLRVVAGDLMDYAYESEAETPIVAGDGSPIVGDLNGDAHTNAADLALLLGEWTGADKKIAECPPSPAADLNADCHVDQSDILILLSNWTA